MKAQQLEAARLVDIKGPLGTERDPWTSSAHVVVTYYDAK